MTPDDARKVASALAGLCTWVRAMALYVDIAKVVKPKMDALADAMADLDLLSDLALTPTLTAGWVGWPALTLALSSPSPLRAGWARWLTSTFAVTQPSPSPSRQDELGGRPQP